jgi:Tol biopolymer transport system component
MRNKSALFTAVALIITVLACDIPTIPTLPPIVSTVLNDDTLATDVAATLNAFISGTPEVTVTPEPPPCVNASVLTIAYTDNGNVWLVEGTNPPVQLTSGGNASGVAISGDGQKVAFTTWDPPTQSSELRAVNSDGSGETVLMSQADLDALPPGLGGALHHTVHRMQFKPCTQDLLFNTRSVFEGPGLATHNDLLEMDTSSGILTVLLPPGSSGAGFVISPDGSLLALSHPDKIEFANIDGSGLIPNAHTYTPVITYSEFQWNPPVQWAPDSSGVGLAMPSQDPFAPGAYGDIWLIQADGSGVVHSATIVADFYRIQYKEITISPNLSSLVYLRDSGTPNIEEIYIANFDGSGETLYDTADLDPQGWSPDSINYAYVVSTAGGNELRIGRLGYAPLTQSTTPDRMRNVNWVDDTRLLFFDGSNPTWTLKLTQLGSGTFTLATTTGTTLPTYDFVPKP